MGMTGQIFADGFKPEPYWWDDVPRDGAAGLPAEALPDRADVVVIGSGYAGLHAAITLARAGSDVVCVEAGPLGFGASTRNGGMVSGGVNVGKHAHLDAAMADEMLGEAAESYGWFEDFIRDEGIDAVYQRCGRFVGAHTSAAWHRQAEQVARLNDIADSGASMVPQDRTHDHLASDFYHGGMLLNRSGAVHPAKLHHGVLATAEAHTAWVGLREGVVVAAAVGRLAAEAGEREGTLEAALARGTKRPAPPDKPDPETDDAEREDEREPADAIANENESDPDAALPPTFEAVRSAYEDAARANAALSLSPTGAASAPDCALDVVGILGDAEAALASLAAGVFEAEGEAAAGRELQRARALTRAQEFLPPFVVAMVPAAGVRASALVYAWREACDRVEEDVVRVALTQ